MSIVAAIKMSLSDNFDGWGMGHGEYVRIMMLGCYTDGCVGFPRDLKPQRLTTLFILAFKIVNLYFVDVTGSI